MKHGCDLEDAMEMSNELTGMSNGNNFEEELLKQKRV